jgi:hypothetical protein
MIKFFRKIRQTSLTQNKVSKYLLYAIGEILLVVVGILIALNINNKNEQKINDDKITSILKEIQQDLVIDIERANKLFDNFIRADSIQDLILNNKYTYNDYKSKKARTLGFTSSAFEINSNGYDNLMRNIDNVPKKYQPIIKDLKHLYVRNINISNMYNARIREAIYKNFDNLWNANNWVLESIKGRRPDEAINYYLNNPLYKKMVALHMNDRKNIIVLSRNHRIAAIEAYNKINELTESTDSIPKIVALESKDTSFLNNIVGNYKIKDSIGVRWAKNIKIINKGNKIHFVDKYRDRELIYNKESNFLLKGTIIYVQFNKPKKGALFISRNINGNATYIKIEN